MNDAGKLRPEVQAFLNQKPVRMFIGGKWVEAADGGTFETRDPGDGEALATVAEGKATDVNRAVEAAIEPAASLAAHTTGVEQLGGREWRWTRRLAPTDDPALLRIAIDVHPAGSDRIAAELVAFRAASSSMAQARAIWSYIPSEVLG